jgi:hypothetical protein
MLTVLTYEHLDLFLELKKNNPGQWKLGIAFEQTVDNSRFFLERLVSEKAFSVGWIEDGKLLSMSSMHDLDNQTWGWLYYANVAQSYMNFSRNHGLEVINEMFKEAAKRKYSTCVTLVRDDFASITSDAVGKMQKTIASWHDQVPEIKKYHWVDEAKIPANSFSKLFYVSWMMGFRTWPVNLRVRLGFLKQEFRNEILFS